MAHSQEKKKLVEIIPEEAQTLDLLDKDFMLWMLKATMDKELKEIRTMCEHVGNFTRERNCKKYNSWNKNSVEVTVADLSRQESKNPIRTRKRKDEEKWST